MNGRWPHFRFSCLRNEYMIIVIIYPVVKWWDNTNKTWSSIPESLQQYKWRILITYQVFSLSVTWWGTKWVHGWILVFKLLICNDTESARKLSHILRVCPSLMQGSWSKKDRRSIRGISPKKLDMCWLQRPQGKLPWWYGELKGATNRLTLMLKQC